MNKQEKKKFEQALAQAKSELDEIGYHMQCLFDYHDPDDLDSEDGCVSVYANVETTRSGLASVVYYLKQAEKLVENY